MPFDLTPLYRTTVGFDRLANLLDAQLSFDGNTNGYPPYNIERVDDNAYRITMAVAGFGDGDIDIEVKENTLTVTGEKTAANGDQDYLHRGIAARNFERRFELADYVEAAGARLENGLLHIDLVREIPEAMKPRKIAITAKGKAKQAISKEAA